MEKFKQNRKCVKCGSLDIVNSFHDVGEFVKYIEVKFPYINRHCRNCQYNWHERPLDYKEKDEAKAKGGFARAKNLTPERRREIAINGAKARWSKAN